MTTYLLFKLLHELAAFWFITGILGRQLVRYHARRSSDVRRLADLTYVAGRFEALMVIPGNVAVVIFGVIAAWYGGWPIFGFLEGADQNWLLVSILLLLPGLVIVPWIFLPRGRIFDAALEEALAAGEVTPRLLASLDDRVVRAAHWVEYVSLLLIIILMVTKPF